MKTIKAANNLNIHNKIHYKIIRINPVPKHTSLKQLKRVFKRIKIHINHTNKTIHIKLIDLAD